MRRFTLFGLLLIVIRVIIVGHACDLSFLFGFNRIQLELNVTVDVFEEEI